ncbi:MAG: transketolase family protein, partial [Cyclobacteriaceae bacterium]|nr:transketolase family protein [Cyclobacteriaceae bacterium]
MIGLAAGMATAGKIPFTGTFANFSTGRVYDQIRQSVAYSGKNVKICASHAGLTLGEDGATHQILEDVGMIKMLPHFTVVVPCDYNQTAAATMAIAELDGPVYLRFGRPSWPIFTDPVEKFIVGKAQKMIDGSDVTLFAYGHMVWFAIQAQEILEKEGISAEVINIHTIKPLDNDAILNSVSKTGCAVVAEEHQVYGGLGESIASLLSRNNPAPLSIVGVNDTFGESGKPEELLKKYGLSPEDIAREAKLVVQKKK